MNERHLSKYSCIPSGSVRPFRTFFPIPGKRRRGMLKMPEGKYIDKKPLVRAVFNWSRWQDLNLWPLRPERSTLPN